MSESRAPAESSFFNVDADFKVHVPNLLEVIDRHMLQITGGVYRHG